MRFEKLRSGLYDVTDDGHSIGSLVFHAGWSFVPHGALPVNLTERTFAGVQRDVRALIGARSLGAAPRQLALAL